MKIFRPIHFFFGVKVFQIYIFCCEKLIFGHSYQISSLSDWNEMERKRIALLNGFLTLFYPPGSKSEALQLGVHLFLLYSIRISLLSAETFFFFWWWMVGGGWWMGTTFQCFFFWACNNKVDPCKTFNFCPGKKKGPV